MGTVSAAHGNAGPRSGKSAPRLARHAGGGFYGARLIVGRDGPQRPARGGVPVSGVAADLILAILSHAAEINLVPKGAIELHWGPGGLQGRIHPVWDTTVSGSIASRLAAQRASAVRDLGTGIIITGDESLPAR